MNFFSEPQIISIKENTASGNFMIKFSMCTVYYVICNQILISSYYINYFSIHKIYIKVRKICMVRKKVHGHIMPVQNFTFKIELKFELK